jgi:hypothetical protein
MEFASPSSSSNGTTASVATADGVVTRVSNTPGIEDAVVNSTSTSSTDNSGDSSIDMLQDSAATHATHRKTFKIVFLGTGVSTAIPVMRHVLTNCCGVCKNAFEIPCSFNRRNNVSIAVLYEDDIEEAQASAQKDGTANGTAPAIMYQKRCVLVDAGKTMRDACMRVLPKYGVANVDGILLTHGHADAILGLDDVR